MEETKQHNPVVIGIIALLFGLLGGFFIGNMMNNDEQQATVVNNETMTTRTTEAENLRVGLNNLLTEHVDLAAPTLRAVFDESEAAAGGVAALDQNSVELAAAIGSVYGEEAEADFLSLWRAHIDFFAAYTVAAREGDAEGLAQAEADLDGYVSEASTFFADATGLPQDALAEGLRTHVSQVFNIAGTWAEGDFEQSYQLQREATMHMGMTADTLAQGIVDSNPDVF